MPFTYNNNPISVVTYNNQQVDIVKYNGQIVFDSGIVVSYTLSDAWGKEAYTAGNRQYFQVMYAASASVNVNSTTSSHPEPVKVTVNIKGGTFGGITDYRSSSKVFNLYAGGASSASWYSSGLTHNNSKPYNEGLGVSTIVVEYKGVTKTVTINRNVPTGTSGVPSGGLPSITTYKTGTIPIGTV